MHLQQFLKVHTKLQKRILNKKKSLVLNCGYGKGYSVKEVVDIFKRIKKNVQVSYKKKRPGDIGQVFANTKKINKI